MMCLDAQLRHVILLGHSALRHDIPLWAQEGSEFPEGEIPMGTLVWLYSVSRPIQRNITNRNIKV
jgi:hypothetical protein